MSTLSGSMFATYRCGRDHGSYASYQDEHLALVERGNIWKRAHGEDVVFKDTAEEAASYSQ